MYGEDEDLAYRAQRRGMRVRFESSVRVMHVGNQGNSQRWSDPERAARVANAELVFLGAHHSRSRTAIIRVILLGASALRAVVHGVTGRASRAEVYRSMARVYAGR
jgi:GT2 family glycosyltransferase